MVVFILISMLTIYLIVIISQLNSIPITDSPFNRIISQGQDQSINSSSLKFLDLETKLEKFEIDIIANKNKIEDSLSDSLIKLDAQIKEEVKKRVDSEEIKHIVEDDLKSKKVELLNIINKKIEDKKLELEAKEKSFKQFFIEHKKKIEELHETYNGRLHDILEVPQLYFQEAWENFRIRGIEEAVLLSSGKMELYPENFNGQFMIHHKIEKESDRKRIVWIVIPHSGNPNYAWLFPNPTKARILLNNGSGNTREQVQANLIRVNDRENIQKKLSGFMGREVDISFYIYPGILIKRGNSWVVKHPVEVYTLPNFTKHLLAIKKLPLN